MPSLPRQAAHQQFIEFVTVCYRDVGCELSYFDPDANSPIAFEGRVDDVTILDRLRWCTKCTIRAWLT